MSRIVITIRVVSLHSFVLRQLRQNYIPIINIREPNNSGNACAMQLRDYSPR